MGELAPLVAFGGTDIFPHRTCLFFCLLGSDAGEVEGVVVHFGDHLTAYPTPAFDAEEETTVTAGTALYFVSGDPAIDGSGKGIAAGDLVAHVAVGFAVVRHEQDGAEFSGELAEGRDLGEDLGAVDPISDVESLCGRINDNQ